MLIPELLIKMTLEQALATIMATPAFLQTLFQPQLSALEVSRIQETLSDKKQPVRVTLGYPLDSSPIQFCVLAITLGAKEEQEQQIGSGQEWDIAPMGDAAVVTSTQGAYFQASYHVNVFATNAQWGAYISYIVQAILQSCRSDLELNGVGLLEQRVSMADYQPDQSWLPDIVFQRAVVLSCKVRDHVLDTRVFEPVTQVIIEPVFVPYDGTLAR
jgi:hypothetical protein